MDSFTDEAKLFIGGIGWDTTEERLRDHFSPYGEVAHAVVMRDRATSQPRGFGFVVFSDPSVIPSVLQQTHTIDGRTVEAKRAMSREQQQTLKTGSNNSGGNFAGSDNLKSKKIFVGGLPSTLTEDEFRGYFEEYGNVTDVVIMYDSNTGRPRGFGFISFTSEDCVDRVLQKTFHELKGKLVEVKRALPKDSVTGGASSRGNSRGYSNFPSNESYNSPLGNSRMGTQPTNGGYQAPQGGGYQLPGGYQAPQGGGYQLPGGYQAPQGGGYQLPGGGYPPYYGGPSYGYGGNTNAGYEVGGPGNTNPGYSGPAGVYGNLASPNADFLKNQWSSQQPGGYGASGYGQAASYGGSVPWNNASRSSGGYAQGGSGRPPSKGYGYNGYGGDDGSNAYGAGNGGHGDGSWRPEN